MSEHTSTRKLGKKGYSKSNKEGFLIANLCSKKNEKKELIVETGKEKEDKSWFLLFLFNLLYLFNVGVYIYISISIYLSRERIMCNSKRSQTN